MDSLLVDPDSSNTLHRLFPELLSSFSLNQNGFDEQTTLDYANDLPLIQSQDANNDYCSSCVSVKLTGQEEIPDFPDDCLKFISDILLEEDLDLNPSSVQDLEATEKSLFEALSSHDPTSTTSTTTNLDHFNSCSTTEVEPRQKSKKRKSRRRRDKTDDDGVEKGRGNKIEATSNEDYVEMEQFDDVLLECNQENIISNNSSMHQRVTQKKKVASEVDLMTLLIQCAQTVSSFDHRGANEQLRQIRQHASPYGDNVQRLAHHVANALEARLAGTGSTISANLVDIKISASDFLRAYRQYVYAIPFKRMSVFLSNTTIAKLAETAKKIHIIDFGVFLGIQWPCLIQALSKRANGPPEIRITGIDYPQQGFRPAERVVATGHRLSGYCKRFGVPFKYKGIAEQWENIEAEDLKMEGDELVIVNCMHRSGTLLDETVDVDQSKSGKDGFLRLVTKLNPALFIQGVVNGTFNAPFFVTRFREAMYFYSSVFDVFEATIPRGAQERLLIESEVFGKEVYNVIACEGCERVLRPETYKQWQVRTARAGLSQAPMDKQLVSKAKAMVKANYHKDFLVDQDQNWMLQGWKGRVICALSFWQPASL